MIDTTEMCDRLGKLGFKAELRHFGADVTANHIHTIDEDNYFRIEVRTESEVDHETETEVVGRLNPSSSGVKEFDDRRRKGYWITATVDQADPNHDKIVVALARAMIEASQ